MEAGPLNLVRPEVPVELAAVVAKMMAKEPGRRFQTPGEVSRALMPFFRPALSQTARPNTATPRVETQIAATQPSIAVPTSTQPATLAADSAPAGKKLPTTGADGVVWESLIAIKDDGPLIEAAKPKLAWIPMEADWANICCLIIRKKPGILDFPSRNLLCYIKS